MSFRRRAAENEAPFEWREGDLETFESPEGLDVRFRLRVLADLLTCPLCRGFFRDAMTIRECLHTFCRVCLVEHFNKGIKSCPTCQERVQGHVLDAMHRDVTLQSLVDKLFPQFEARENREKRKLYTLCGLLDELGDLAPLTDWYSSDEEEEEEVKSTVGTVGSSGGGSDVNGVNNEVSGDGGKPLRPIAPAEGAGWEGDQTFFQRLARSPQEAKDVISKHCNTAVALEPSPECSLPSLPKPYLRLPQSMPVEVLMKYIASKLRLQAEDVPKLELYLEGQLMPKSHTLEFICRSRFLDRSQGLRVSYRYIGQKPQRITVSPMLSPTSSTAPDRKPEIPSVLPSPSGAADGCAVGAAAASYRVKSEDIKSPAAKRRRMEEDSQAAGVEPAEAFNGNTEQAQQHVNVSYLQQIANNVRNGGHAVALSSPSHAERRTDARPNLEVGGGSAVENTVTR